MQAINTSRPIECQAQFHQWPRFSVERLERLGDARETERILFAPKLTELE
jgi:hypothetical protein